MEDKDLNRSPTVEVLYEANATLAEGPFYDEETGILLWVDQLKGTVNFFDPINKTNRSVLVSDTTTVSIVIPVRGSTKLLVLVGTKICLIDRESGSITDELGSVEAEYSANSFNDAKCDSSGRLWAGTYSKADASVTDRGSGLYSYSNGTITRHCDSILSNGIAWNLTDDVMFFVDSLKRCIFSFKYSKEDGSITDQQLFIDYGSKCPELGLPDGMCLDIKGRLWVVGFGVHKVTCWDLQTRERVMDIDVPWAKNVTSCCFGGPNYEWMFLTSGTAFLNEEDLKKYPHNGSLFVIKDLGTRGLPPNKFSIGDSHI